MRYLFLFCFSFIQLFSMGQMDYLKDYIPYDTCSFDTHPVLNIKTWVHVVQKSKSQPENITIDSMNYLKRQYNWINQMYGQLKPPSVENQNGEKPYVKDARIRFIIDTISFHIDENSWDRIKVSTNENPKKWLDILKIDSDSSTILIKGVRNRYRPILDSIVVRNTKFNNGLHYVEKVKKIGRNTLIFLKDEVLVSEDTIGIITYYQKIDKNCNKDNWEKYTQKDKNFLHVFYTGASDNGPAFGCGPSPFFLNISKVINNGGYATAQLIAHEFGHCIGLRHTNTPQFKDLPKGDKFGWIKCNESNTSNNIMGYNTCRNYLSPLQIAHVHYRYSNINSLANTIKTISNKKQDVYIYNPTSWNKSIICNGNIIVKKKQTLTITEKIIIPENGYILLEKKAKIIVNGGKILNLQNKWGGIIKCKSEYSRHKLPKKDKNKPVVELLNNGEIIY